MTLLQVEGLSVQAGDLSLVEGVDLDIRPGEVVALVGESGSGKSLTALSIMGLLAEGLQVTGGQVRLDGEPLTARRLARLRGLDLAMIFQEPVSSLNPLMPVGAQVAESLIVHGRASAAEARIKAIDMLRRVGIPDPERRADQLPAELSGGMCQRVMIAAALISRPRLLIADEPTTALDVTIQAQILALIGDLAREVGTAVLFITHDMGVVAELADRVCVMYGGRVVEQGPVADLFAAPRHPYTAMLLRTIPRLTDPPRQELFVIRGNVPSPRDWPEGCRFRTRCPRADAACRRRPVLTGTGHRVACVHPMEAP
ncbi:ABC transporter ATP-binding protein [Maliponia aquimaris]|uniref:Oligopeptide transport ATP-binding protein OppD n=1 Tax=Maliponia aquimaris TaxID=1673631 RepID=A0A238KUT4_9RHOB|nr:ABC transporter ATP-binding protein [Maliponia aquimaris]SMX46467.1 Oligopeptide transport ATP-binding protein OppD [Maliponia aquimaris]